MIEEIYNMQRLLNNRVLGFDIFSIDKDDEKVKWFRNYLTAYRQELCELLESLELDSIIVNSDKRRKKIDIENIKIEIIDMLHFLISMFQVIGEKTIDEGKIDGNPETLEKYFVMLESNFEKKYGFSLIASAGDLKYDRNIIFIANINMVSTGLLMDCIQWKWWAKQSILWEKALKILYRETLPHWGMLAIASGMNAEEVTKLYFKKNELNFFRQEKGYKEGTYSKVDSNGKEDNKKLFR